jgi:hypothetical protein
VGVAVKLIQGATFSSGSKIPEWLFNNKLYIKNVRKDGKYSLSKAPSGSPSVGVVDPINVISYESAVASANFEPYVALTLEKVDVYAGPGNRYKINDTISKHSIYTIVEEKNNFGRLKINTGWIELDKIKKIK